MKKKKTVTPKKRQKPIRLSPKGRKQVAITPAVRAFVEGLKPNSKSKLDHAKRVVEAISRFKKKSVSMDEAKRLWAKRSADEVIKTRVVYTMPFDRAAQEGTPAILGCTDYAVAVAASLRALELPALIIREGAHTKTKFVHRNRWWLADPTDRKRPKVRPMTRADERIAQELRRQKSYAEGPSLAQIGLLSYKDFLKYRPENNRANQ